MRLNPIALLALPLVLVVGKLTGLYDRDEHLIRKTTLDEVPTLFWVATLYALLIFLAGDLIVDGGFGRDQAVGVWALLFASMVDDSGSRQKRGPKTSPARSDAWSWATPRRQTGSCAGSVRRPG